MRYILINPATETVSEVEHDGQVDWRVIQIALGDKPIEAAGTLPNGDILWVDEEGLLSGPNHFFHMGKVNQQPLAGRGVITGPEEMPPGKTMDDCDPEIVSARSSLEEISEQIAWLDRMQATSMTFTVKEAPGVTVFEQKTTIEPA